MALIADFVTGKPVSFRRVRHLLAQMGLQEGAVGASDLKVAQRAASANMSVDVATGEAWVQVETGLRNGVAHLTHDAVTNVSVPASDATNPTVHSVVAQYNDTAIPAGVGGDDPTLRLIAGAPTAGATLDNRNGAPAMPADALLLADVLVPAGSLSIPNANIRDRRSRARGFDVSATVSGTYDVSGGTFTIITGTALRIEPRSPVELSFQIHGSHSLAEVSYAAQPHYGGTGFGLASEFETASVAGRKKLETGVRQSGSLVGSVLVDLRHRNPVGSGTYTATVAFFRVRELIAGTGHNN